MGACASKAKTVEGKATIQQAPKVAPDTTIPADQVAADQTTEKVAEEAKEEPAAAELPTDVVGEQKAEATTVKRINTKEEEVEEKIVEEEKPSAPIEEMTAAELVKKTTEVKNAEEKGKATQQS